MQADRMPVVTRFILLCCVLNPLTFLPTAGYLLWRAQRIRRRNNEYSMARVAATRVAVDDCVDDQGMIWYFAFGANMSPDTLGKVRKVYPVQSKACQVLGYTLTFSHSGLPYIEPGFGTIEPLSLHPIPPTLRIAASQLHQSGAPSGRAMLYSTPPAPLATALKAAVAAGDDKIRDPLSPQAANGSPVASPELPISFGPAKRASKQGRDGAALDNSDHEQEAIASDSGPSSIHLSNGHSADTASDPQNADHIVVHGVVHQISHAEMRQVIKTESGGGSGNRGYYAAKVQCELYEGGCVQALALLTHPNSMHHQAVPSLPSRRYLQILQHGAKHSELAQEYQDYLALLDYYQATHRGQRLGAFITANIFGKPLKYLIMQRLPTIKHPPLVSFFHLVFSWIVISMWLLHDNILEPILGSGRHN